MSFPWVSREEYDRLKAEFGQVVRQDNASWWSLREELATEHKRYDALLEKYHALKLAGAVALPPVVPFTPREADPYDELKVLIAEQSGTDLRRRGMMLRQLKQDLADGVSVEEIRQRIETGIVPDGVPV